MGQVGGELELPFAVLVLGALGGWRGILLSVVTVGGKNERVLFQEDSSETPFEIALSRKFSMLERSRALLEDLVASLPPPFHSRVKRDLLPMCLPFSSTWR